MPAFTIITATWNRSHHILPTIRSVLGQSFTDFEYLVIGDDCTDDTESVVRAIADPRIRWLSTSERWRSQSGPNNLGLEQAQGRFIAYLGHDDLWTPDNLAAHAGVLQSADQPDFSVCGCFNHGAPGTGIVALYGLFDPDELPDRFFFVPSSIAHRHDVAARIGKWKRPGETALNVDVDFILRAKAAGLRFVSTGKPGTHKFTAADRYLSGLLPESGEQAGMLARMSGPGWPQEQAAYLNAALAQGTRAVSGPLWDNSDVPGERAGRLRMVRGVDLPPLIPLDGPLRLPQSPGWRGQDWHGFMAKSRFRPSGPNPTPRLLIPVTAAAPVWLTLDVLHPDPKVAPALRFRLNGADAKATLSDIRVTAEGSRAKIRLAGLLHPDRPSVLQILHPPGAMIGDNPRQLRGVAVGTLSIRFAPPASNPPLRPNRPGGLARYLRPLTRLLTRVVQRPKTP